MNEVTPTPQSPDASLSIGQKLIRILTSPAEVFQTIRSGISWRDWVIPFVVVVAVSGVAGILNAPYTLEFSQQAIRAQQKRFLQREMPQEQRQQMEQRFEQQIQKQADRYTPPQLYYLSFTGVAIRIALVLFVLAALYYFGGNTILGGKAAFPQLLALVSLPQMVTVLESVYNTLIMHLKGSAEVPASLAVLLPYGATDLFRVERYQQALFTLLSQINVFTVWRLILFAIGFGVIYQVSKAKAGGVVFGYWVLWLILTTAGAFMFAGL